MITITEKEFDFMTDVAKFATVQHVFIDGNKRIAATLVWKSFINEKT